MDKQLQSLSERVAEKVGKELVDLIPQDEWQDIIDSQVRHFRTTTGPKIIQELLASAYTGQVQIAIDQLLSTQEWNELTNTYTPVKLKEFLAESGGQIFAGVLAPAMSMVLQDLQNRLNNGY